MGDNGSMSRVAAKKHIVEYESNPFALISSVLPAFRSHSKLFLRAIGLTFAVILGLVVLVGLPSLVVRSAFFGTALDTLIVNLFGLLISSIVLVGLVFLASLFINLALVDLEAEKLNYHQLIEHSRTYIIPLLGLYGLFLVLITALVFSLVGILFIPYLVARFAIAQFVIVHENRKIFDALSRAGVLMHGRLFEMLGLLAASSAVSSIVTTVLVFSTSLVIILFAAMAVILSRQAWLFVPLILLILPVLIFVTCLVSFIMTLAIGKRYLQLHAVVTHKLRPRLKTQANLLALVAFFIIFIFTFMYQLVFLSANIEHDKQIQGQSALDRN